MEETTYKGSKNVISLPRWLRSYSIVKLGKLVTKLKIYGWMETYTKKNEFLFYVLSQFPVFSIGCLDPDEAPYPPVRYLCELSFLPYHHFVDWAKSTVVLPPKHVLHDVMTSHPGYEWRHRDQRWPWHRPRTDASGLLGDVTKPPTSHPGSLADSTVTTVDLAAGQDVRHRLRRPTM